MTKKFRLPEGNKAAWVQALRSGRYVQGVGALKSIREYTGHAGIGRRHVTRHCCLGVYAEEGGAMHRCLALDVEVCSTKASATTTLTDSCFLPPTVLPMDVQAELSTKNDCEGQTFEEIADWIEENL